MEQVVLEANKRLKVGKGEAKRLRLKGLVPAILYGKELKPLPLILSSKKVSQILNKMGHNAIISLQVRENDEKIQDYTVMIKEIQRDAIKDRLLHIDLQQISLQETLISTVPLVLVGECKGIKERGIVEQVLREIEIESLPTDIPDQFEIDISNLGIGDNLHIKDLVVSSKIKILTPEDEVIVTVLAPAKEEEEVVKVAPEKEEVTELAGEEKKEEVKKE